MEQPEVKEKVLSVLDGNYNLPLYSQQNRLYLAEQISNAITGKPVVAVKPVKHAKAI